MQSSLSLLASTLFNHLATAIASAIIENTKQQ